MENQVANAETATEVKAPKATKVEKPVVITGSKNEDGTININKADVVKPNSETAKSLGLTGAHHIAKLSATKGAAFIWDTREIVAEIDLSALPEGGLNKSVRDLGTPLVVPTELVGKF